MIQFLALFLSIQLFANDQFDELREDHTVPGHCQEMNFSFYPLPVEHFTFGREGALEVGFTFEYPLKRSNATILWKYFKSLVKGKPNQGLKERILEDPELKRDYLIIKANYSEMGFDFTSEGEILEILAIQDLYKEFPSNHYFITGSIEYHHSPDEKTIGEIDVFIGSRKSCEGVAVGEVKLGWIAARKKARKQLRRFSDFLSEYNAGPIVQEYEPSAENQKNH